MAASLRWMYFLKKVRGSGEGVCALEIIATERMTAATIPRPLINAGGFNCGLNSINTRFYIVCFPCKGVDHMYFSADGLYLIASCEFGTKVIKSNSRQF